MTQPSLFDAQTLTPDDYARLGEQCATILRLLERGPQTNKTLSAVALKYTGRISDLRKSGYLIVCRRIAGGLTEYRLERAS